MKHPKAAVRRSFNRTASPAKGEPCAAGVPHDQGSLLGPERRLIVEDTNESGPGRFTVRRILDPLEDSRPPSIEGIVRIRLEPRSSKESRCKGGCVRSGSARVQSFFEVRLCTACFGAVCSRALIAASCSTSSGPTPPASPSVQGNDIDIVMSASTMGSAAFNPNPKSVSLNGAQTVDVRWVNDDAVTHHIVSDNGTSFDTGLLAGSAASTKSVPAGTFPFHCMIHPTMVGTLNVSQ